MKRACITTTFAAVLATAVSVTAPLPAWAQEAAPADTMTQELTSALSGLATLLGEIKKAVEPLATPSGETATNTKAAEEALKSISSHYAGIGAVRSGFPLTIGTGETQTGSLVFDGADIPSLQAEVPDMLGAITNEFSVPEKMDIYFGSDDPARHSLGRMLGVAAYNAVAADSVSRRVVVSSSRLESLMEEFEQSDSKLRDAIDINTRLLFEIAQQNNEQLKLQSSISALLGMYVASQSRPSN